MTRPTVLVITTGGTLFQREQDGKMEIALHADQVTGQCELDCDITLVEIGRRAGAEITFQTLQEIATIVEESDCDASVLITGTDSMEEVAFALDAVYSVAGPFTVCGAMKPSDILGYDGIANFNDAVKVALSQEAKSAGVLVVMNDTIHCARYVRKYDSSLTGSFQSHPGPLGEIRRGRPHFYYKPIAAPNEFGSFDSSKADSLSVPILTMSLGFHQLSDSMLDECDGLVIAGMGTGSVSEKIVDQLSPKWTLKKPIILATRCWAGQSYDDYYYRGSLKK